MNPIARCALPIFELFTAAPLFSQPATLNVDLSKPLHKVSPTLYGLMTEEINHSYDGGLYAEMVRNRTFQDHGWDGIAHWTVVEKGNSDASMSIDTGEGPSAALQHSLRLDVKRADGGNAAGVRNDGYWGMAVGPNTTYQGSLYAKAEASADGPLSVSLVSDNSGKPVAAATIESLSTEWKRYEFTLKTGAVEASAENHLQLTVGDPGKFWFVLVSLFPPTYKDRVNGNRIDLMEKLAAMHPTFLRLPGGNYLEGDEIQERFDWKRTIGPLVDRPTHRSPWGYQSSDGLGLLEFLEWCEDLNIEPVLAVYAGYSLKGAHVTPGPALEPYVEDALDEIEFVQGSASTHWGAVRAKYGHPAPFPLTYVEVGNEDEFDRSGSYEGRFAQFLRAIKAKYPQLQVIATAAVKRSKPDVVDDHYYKTAKDMFALVKHYDEAERSGPKIFVGEWATREGSPTSNLGAALADAAWMTAMERNSDLIVMSCYAPLFVNVNPGGMQWRSDLIGYDTVSSYGSPSYYAQSLFAQYLGSEAPTSSLTGGGDKFFYSASSDPAKGYAYLKLVNGSSEAQDVEINLAGAAKVAKENRMVTLKGNSNAETNSITAPKRVIPEEEKIRTETANFHHVVPPYAIQILEIKVK